MKSTMLSEATKNRTLDTLAKLLKKYSADIISANQKDLDEAENLDPTLLDRLKVDKKKVNGMIRSVKEVRAKDDPVGKILYSYNHENGMHVENRVVPFGKILIIYESRPDVTIEAAISAFKSGNRILLKGGKESHNSNTFLVSLWHQALRENEIGEEFVTYLTLNRSQTQKLLSENTHNLDLIIPRGGEGLINFIKKNSSVPVIVSGRGNNFIYIDEEADFKMAVDLVLNGKSRLSVCNAIDKVVLNKNLTDFDKKLKQLISALKEKSILLYGDDEKITDHADVSEIPDEKMYKEEFLSAKMLLILAESTDEAINLINAHSGGHSAVIVTSNNMTAREFLNNVDCAAVYHNVSSRFTDGGQFGFGAEMAISTQKLHFRGPVGLGQLVTNKWFITGDGQVRK
jgi:glutamate-5-semialdehyde dehydrogenase